MFRYTCSKGRLQEWLGHSTATKIKVSNVSTSSLDQILEFTQTEVLCSRKKFNKEEFRFDSLSAYRFYSSLIRIFRQVNIF